MTVPVPAPPGGGGPVGPLARALRHLARTPPRRSRTAHSSRATTLNRAMSLSVQVGLLLAVVTALTSIVGFLYKHRGSVDAPPVEFSRPVSSSLALFRSPWYVLGIGIATASWGLHVAALSLAPISLVQSTIAGGLVLLTVVADRVFGHDVSR